MTGPSFRPPRRAPRALLLGVVLAALAAIAGCLPSTDGRPRVAVLDAPRPAAVDGSADALIAALPGGEARPYDLVSRRSLSFLETRRDLDDAGAEANAAALGRNRGAALVVMIAAPDPQRRLERAADGAPRAVEASVFAEAVVIASADARVLGRYVGPVLTGRRDLDPDAAPPEDPRDDPLVRELALRSVRELAPQIDAALRAALPLADPGE